MPSLDTSQTTRAIGANAQKTASSHPKRAFHGCRSAPESVIPRRLLGNRLRHSSRSHRDALACNDRSLPGLGAHPRRGRARRRGRSVGRGVCLLVAILTLCVFTSSAHASPFSLVSARDSGSGHAEKDANARDGSRASATSDDAAARSEKRDRWAEAFDAELQLVSPALAYRRSAPSTPAPDASKKISEAAPVEATSSTASPKKRGRGVPPFYLRKESDTHTTTALYLPPIYLHRVAKPGHPEKLLHLDLSLTFGWHSKSKEKNRYINPVGLFFGGFSKQRSAWAMVPLLMGYKRVGESFRFGQFPLVWWWGNREVKNLLVAPVHFQQKRPNGFRGMSLLLAWYGHENLQDNDPSNDKRYTIFAPLYLGLTKGTSKLHLSPVFIAGSDERKGVKHRTAFPFFHRSTLEFGNRKELWTPLYVQRSDRARAKKTWIVPPALSFSRETRSHSTTAWTPLVWRLEDKLRASSTWLIGPMGAWGDPKRRVQWAFPFYLRMQDTAQKASASLMLPLYYARKNDQGAVVHTALGFGSRGLDKSWSFGVHPLLTYAKYDPNKGTRVIAAGGLFWRAHQPASAGTPLTSRWGVGPLVYSNTRGERRDFGIVPLVFAGRDGTKRYQVITPLVWHIKDTAADVQRDTWITGPAYMHRQGADRQFGLAPLYFGRWGGDRRWHIAPPLLTFHVADQAKQTSRTVSPFFVRAKSPDSSALGVLWLGWDVKRSDGRDSLLFPLYYRRSRGDTSWWATPIGGMKTTPAGRSWVLGTTYRIRNADARGFGIAPLFFRHEQLTGDNVGVTTAVFPFYAKSRHANADVDMFTPFVWRAKFKNEALPREALAAFPFYMRRRQPGGIDLDAGLLWMYGRNKTRKTHLLIAGPFYHRVSRKGLHTGVVPLTWWKDTEDSRHLVALPLVYHFQNKANGERTTVGLPFWFDRVRPDGSRVWFAFPAAVGTRGRHNYTRVGLGAVGYLDIFRLSRRTRIPNEKEDAFALNLRGNAEGVLPSFRFSGWLPLYFRYDQCGFRKSDDPACRYTVRGSFPFFMYGSNAAGRKTHAAALLYYFDRRPNGARKIFTLLGGYAKDPGKRLTIYGLTFVRDVSNEVSLTTVIPLFWHKQSRRPDALRSTTWVLGPVYTAQRNGDKRWFQTAGLFWQFRTPVKVSTAIIPPIFFRQHVFKERKLSWLLPLYLDDNKIGSSERWTVAFPLLAFDHRKKEARSFVQFPLVWHFKRDASHSTTLGFPLYLDIKRAKKRVTMVPFLYARRSTPTLKRHIIGPFLARWDREKEGALTSLHWRALVGVVGGGRVGSERYMQVFWLKIPLKPESAAQVSRRLQREDVRQARLEQRAAKVKTRRAQRQADAVTRVTRHAKRATRAKLRRDVRRDRAAAARAARVQRRAVAKAARIQRKARAASSQKPPRRAL